MTDEIAKIPNMIRKCQCFSSRPLQVDLIMVLSSSEYAFARYPLFAFISLNVSTSRVVLINKQLQLLLLLLLMLSLLLSSSFSFHKYIFFIIIISIISIIIVTNVIILLMLLSLLLPSL